MVCYPIIFYKCLESLTTTYVKILDLYLFIGNPIPAIDNASSEYTDVIVKLDNNNKYIASFFSYKSIEKLKVKHQKTGEYLFGKYFKVNNMVLVESCTIENVREVVLDLLEENDFLDVFKLLTK